MSISGGNGGFAKSFRTREAGFKGAGTLKSRLEQREAAIKKQREAFAARALSSPPSKKEGKG